MEERGKTGNGKRSYVERRKESRVTMRGKVGLAETGQEGRREERRKVEGREG